MIKIKDKVAILLSTYNGEKYLSEQIKSIIGQSYKYWVLYIRDDGSNDKTLQIINDFCQKNVNIIYLADSSKENIGVKKSFFELVKFTQEKYIMFCDQDDVWLPDKVSDTLEFFKSQEIEGEPLLVYTDLEVVNQKLKTESQSMIRTQKLRRNNSLSSILVQNPITGCTSMINRSLIDILRTPGNEKNFIMHDWWMGLVAATFGNVVLLDKATILYRQHSNNAVGYQTRLQRMKNSLNISKMVNSLSVTIVQAICFLNIYEDIISENNRKVIDDYINLFEKNLFFRYKLLYKNKFNKSGFERKLGFHYLILFCTRTIRNNTKMILVDSHE